MPKKRMQIAFAIDEELKERFDLLCEDLFEKGYFKSKTEFLQSIIGWASKNRNEIDWASIRFWKTAKKDED